MGLTDSGVVGGGALSLCSSSSNTMGFQLIHHPSINRQMLLEKGGGVYAWSEHCVKVQM